MFLIAIRWPLEPVETRSGWNKIGPNMYAHTSADCPQAPDPPERFTISDWLLLAAVLGTVVLWLELIVGGVIEVARWVGK